ncbi:MAG: aminotransferase class V-fold PLP-dependent enzyme [Acetobacteraceae bacterium]|nr:aminotransferase class V-fold PLP-dependent enzyme [Acetobacteraceae bacterium]
MSGRCRGGRRARRWRAEVDAAIGGEFLLEEGFATVNHGAYGATPRAVLAAQDDWRARMERQPSRFFNGTILPALRSAAEELGGFLGARGVDIGFVGNATEGMNGVLRSLAFAPGDEIVVLAHVYGAVRNTVRHVCSVSGARMVEVPVAFPRPDDGEVLAGLAAALGPRVRLAVLDHITSSSALLLPIVEMVALCHARGVKVLVDGAHAPGQVALDLAALDADWYVGNCHKWLFAPKGCGFLWARGDRQEGIHPAVISHGYGQGFAAEFDWTGTRDPSAWLAVPAALAFHARLGGAGLMARNVALAASAAAGLAARFGTETGAGNRAAGAMATVRLPDGRPADRARAEAVRARLLAMGTDVPVMVHNDRLWLRLSAQAYNDPADFERMGALVTQAVAAV